jgi:hypothetical protein
LCRSLAPKQISLALVDEYLIFLYRKEGLPGFIYLGFIFSRGSIYLLRIYWDLLAESVFQPTHTHTIPPLALTLTLTKPSPSLSGGIM